MGCVVYCKTLIHSHLIKGWRQKNRRWFLKKYKITFIISLQFTAVSSYCESLHIFNFNFVGKSVITCQYQIFLWRHPVLTQFYTTIINCVSFLLNRADHENVVKMMKNISFNQIFTPRSRWHEFIFHHHHHRWMLRYDSTEFYQKRVKVGCWLYLIFSESDEEIVIRVAWQVRHPTPCLTPTQTCVWHSLTVDPIVITISSSGMNNNLHKII